MKNTALVRLFEILNAAEKRRIKRPSNLDKELVYKAVFGKLKKLNESKLTQLRFKLYRFIEDQIVIEQIIGVNENKEHLIQKELILLEYYRDKVVPSSQRSVEGIARLVESKMGDLEKIIKLTKVRDIYYHLNMFRLSHFLYYNLNEEIRGEGKPYLDRLMNNLDIFYSLSKLRYSFEIIQRRKITNEKELPIFLFDEVYEYSENLDTKEFPLVSIYRLLADLSNVLDEARIVELKNKLTENIDQLGNAEMISAYFLLLNFMTRINREKHIDTAFMQYEVYQIILEKKLCIVNGEIRPQFLINCAVNFVSVGRSKEIQIMLNENKKHIPKNYKDKTVKLCSAYQLFGDGEYIKCSELIYQQSFLPFNLQAKILLLKSLYEIEFILKKSKVSFYDVLDNYKRFIRRKKKQMNENFYQATSNFAICILMLTDNNDTKELEKYFNNLNFLIERKWLLDKIKKK